MAILDDFCQFLLAASQELKIKESPTKKSCRILFICFRDRNFLYSWSDGLDIENCQKSTFWVQKDLDPKTKQTNHTFVNTPWSVHLEILGLWHHFYKILSMFRFFTCIKNRPFFIHTTGAMLCRQKTYSVLRTPLWVHIGQFWMVWHVLNWI